MVQKSPYLHEESCSRTIKNISVYPTLHRAKIKNTTGYRLRILQAKGKKEP
jgi:hypothetical protein